MRAEAEDRLVSTWINWLKVRCIVLFSGKKQYGCIRGFFFFGGGTRETGFGPFPFGGKNGVLFSAISFGILL